MQQIIYYDTLYNCWCMTAEVNYLNHIRNERCVVKGNNFASAEELRDYLVNLGYGTKDQYIIIPREEQQ